jgi:ankyrin repeat protein
MTAMMNLCKIHGFENYSFKNIKIIKILLEHNSDPNLRSIKGKTVLTMTNDIRIVRLLLDYDAVPCLHKHKNF